MGTWVSSQKIIGSVCTAGKLERKKERCRVSDAECLGEACGVEREGG